MKTIGSRQNPWFKRVREAIREHGDEIVIEGPKSVGDAVAAGWVPIVIVRRTEMTADVPRVDQEIVFTSELFDAVAETKTSQGLLGVFQRPRFALADLLARKDTIVVALDGVQDPGNVGTIVRLAAAFDAAGVALLPGCADAFGPKAIRASAGTILSVPVVECSASDLAGCSLPLFTAEQTGRTSRAPSRNAIIVFGSEGTGVSRAIREAAKPIAIPMSSRVESLNVAAAAAILLAQAYEARTR